MKRRGWTMWKFLFSKKLHDELKEINKKEQAEIKKAYYERNKESLKLTTKLWAQDNSEKITEDRAKKKEYFREYYRNNKEKYKKNNNS
jgi:hypothetical protein